MKRWGWVFGALALLAGAVSVVLIRRRIAGPDPLMNSVAPVERRARSDPEALRALVQGDVSRVGLDLGRLQELKEANYKPLMEYLGYIQVQRGGSETLLFVRTRDLDEMAALAGQSRDEFVKQFKKLGVLLSMN
jgi:hypothetical protein